MIRTLAVHGLGYVGLPTAAVFADAGLDVTGVDVNAEVVAAINAGRAHIVEPNLDALVRRVVEAGKLTAATDPPEADVHVIAVPTPLTEDRRPDLTCIDAAARAIAPALAPGTLVILESTSPVGTTERLAAHFAAARPDLTFPQTAGDLADIQIAHCPERVLPGRVLVEVVANPRIIGGLTRHCSARAVAFYRRAVTGPCHVTNARTAELAKLAENAYRDVNIAFANELSLISADLAIDPWELIAMANQHPRVGILSPGPGVGGHCVAVDPWFIADSAPQRARLIRTAREINDAKPGWVVDRVAAAALGREAPVIACLGLAYKADVDDLRESPAITVTRGLIERKIGRILVAEPHIRALPSGLPGAELVDLDEAIRAADILVFLTGHAIFRDIRLRDLDGKSVIDACGAVRFRA